MTGTSLIEIRPDVMLGKPCLAGTRIPVSSEERAQRTRFGPAGWARSSPFGAGPARPVRF